MLDDAIYDKLIYTLEPNGNKLAYFFYPEIKNFKKDKETEKIEKELISIDSKIFDRFDEKRHEGENESYICSLIRQDSVEDFISHVNKANIHLNSRIKHSIFETNVHLIEKEEIPLIEYSAFFGSIQIFQYLVSNKVEINPSLFLDAIHSQNDELIYLLESHNKESVDNESLFIESIKCHHNNIAEYIKNNMQEIDNADVVSAIIHYHNYQFFTSELGRFHFFYFGQYNHKYLFDLYIKQNMQRIQRQSHNLKEAAKLNQIEIIYYILSKESVIESEQFQNIVKLTHMIIPSSITKIKNQAFNGCTSLKCIFFENPSSLTSIEKEAFNRCSSLEQITILSDEIEFRDDVTDGVSIGELAFAQCSSLTKITIPSSVTLVGDEAFSGCSSLKQLTILSSDIEFGQYVFYGFENMELKVY